jgi:uncharacterized protein (DUF697 family)
MPAPAHDDVLAESEAFDAYEENAAKEIRRWADGDPSAFSKALRLLSKPLDWAAERSATESAMKEVNERIVAVLDSLSEASTWTYDPEHVLGRARDDIDLADTASLADLRAAPMPRLDELARTFFTENTILSALEGGGTGLGGVALLAADVPILFTINLRLIQQVAASYGFRFGGPRARPLVLRVFSAAVADTPEARQEALRELRAAGKAAARGEAPGTDRDDIGVAAASSEGTEGTDTTENQSRVLINEIARNIAAREMAQLIPLAGAATGAGLNYWFTSATAETAYMLSRALFLEHRRLQQQQA